MAFTPSKFQKDIYDQIRRPDGPPILVNAVAGSGKTTTIANALEIVPVEKSCIFLAFNRDIVKELRKRTPDRVDVKTLHAFGLNELRFKFNYGRIIPNEKFIDDSKISKIIVKHAETWVDVPEEERASYCGRIERLVDLYRLTLPQSRTELLELIEKFDINVVNGEIDRAKDVLRAANADKTCFDFVDMIYQPATGDWRLLQYDFVFVDEAQDMNRAQHNMIKKIVKPGGRLIAVGDPRQAIYGFSGADSNSFNNIKGLFPNTVEMPLSVCYRSASAIIEHAQEIVPYIQAREGAPVGEVRQGSISEIADGDFVLCRNTRPLVSLCMKLISQGRKATIKGSDIGKNLINMVRGTKKKGIEPMFNILYRELDKVIAKAKEKYPLRAPDEVASVANYTDKIEAIRTLSDGMRDTEELVAKIESIFVEDVYGIVLSTMHKSKGLEADNVFIIDKHLLPSRAAKQAWEIEQERNLDYVARTRAKNKLIYINDWVSDPNRRRDLKDALSRIKI